MHQLRVKGNTVEASFYEEFQKVFGRLPMDYIKFCLENLMLCWEEKIFTNQQMGMTADMKITVLMVSE